MAQPQHTATTGAPFDVQASGGHPPLRRELNDLIKDKIPFSLLIQALVRMQNTPEQEDLSYYQICGIHGLPYKAWQGAGGNGAARTGYCTHSSNLFPTWHRPYLALFEQILCKHARDIAAETASGNQEWKDAAENLRLPYWDWAIKKMPPSEVMTMTSIDVVKPDGTTMTIDQNPLFAYNFKDQSSISTVERNRTRRGDPIWLDDNGTTELRIKVSQMFDTIHDWFGFSNDARFEETTASHANSLEAIHDQIHGDVGGFMGSIPTAAFDPLFWLHHCMIDRLFALWQIINPGVWVEERNNQQAATWTIPRFATVSTNTPLTPFYTPAEMTSGGSLFWNSTQSELTSTFGYSYPELANLATANPQAEMQAIVLELYGSEAMKNRAAKVAKLLEDEKKLPNALKAAAPMAKKVDLNMFPNVNAASKSQALQAPAQMVFAAIAPAAVFGSGNAAAEEAKPQEDVPASADPGHDDQPQGSAQSHDTGLTDWTARITVQKYALGASFRVCIFLVPDGQNNSIISETDASGWPSSPYYVGSMCAFVNGTHLPACDNCVEQQENNLVIEGYVPLDEAIVEKSGLSSFAHEEVHDYLQRNLVWRCQKIEGDVVPMSSIPSLQVSIWSSTLVFDPRNSNSATSKWTAPHCHVGITAGQPGGCQHGADAA